MSRTLSIFLLLCLAQVAFADRIYLMNSSGYQEAKPALIAAIQSNGHTVTVVNNQTTLPTGFTSTCMDPVNGYDWLLFFGNNNYSSLLPQIQQYIFDGGKVYYQYEVSCCVASSSSIANILSGLTGLSITPNSNSYIALWSGGPAWTAENVGCCDTFIGNAYKALDGLPIANQLQATANINGSSPSINTAINFGFKFTTTDFSMASSKGAITGIGDVNFWYDGHEPTSSWPVNQKHVDFFWPNAGTTCYMFPPGCNVSSSQTITLGSDTLLCPGDSITLDAYTPGATYQWSDNSSDSVLVVHQTGTYWVDVTVGNCTRSDTIEVIAASAYSLHSDTTICVGDQLILDATTPGATYKWQDNSTNPTFTVTQTGTYWVEITGPGCTFGDTVDVTAIAPPVVNLGPDLNLCTGQTHLLDATTANATYLWSDNSTSPTLLVSQPGTYWVEVSNNNCTDRDTITINYTNVPPINLGNDTTLCPGSTIILDATTSGATYLWQDNLTTATHMVNQAGTYSVRVTIANCSVYDTIDIQYLSPQSINLGPDQTLCSGDMATLQVNLPGATFLWQDNSTQSDYLVTQPGIYWVVATVSGCTTSDTVEINYTDLPIVDIGEDPAICPGESTILDATTPNASDYLWQDHSTNPTYVASEPGTYFVAVTANSCTASDTIEVLLETDGCTCIPYIPSAFSPNQDNLNDNFYPYLECTVANYSFRIYNRWGQMVFETLDQNSPWDGTFKGQSAPMDAYVYVILFETADGESHQYQGNVTLIR